jgi:ABC-type nitrate/sulfonate/bicarbonate transport system ATPase subunit
MLTLLENVMLPMDYADWHDFDERPEHALELLKMVGLEKFVNIRFVKFLRHICMLY